MLLFGHAGLTLGVVALANAALTKDPKSSTGGRFHNDDAWPLSLTKRIDVRLLLLGSLLPDILDKPVGRLFFSTTFANGRIFGHTLLFLTLISLIGYYLRRKRRQAWLLVLALGTFIHLVLDEMWLALPTLLWPLYGWIFPRSDIDWMQSILERLLTDSVTLVLEIVGLVILVWFAWTLVRRKSVWLFIKRGQVYLQDTLKLL